MQVTAGPATTNLHQRLRRIEGQVRGVQKMLDEERSCQDVLQQLNAIHAAVENATQVFMRAYAKECLAQMESVNGDERDVVLDNLLDLMAKVR